MQFPTVFSRYVGGSAGLPVLGDGAATGDLVPKCDIKPGVGAANTNSSALVCGDNILICPRRDLSGWPPQRIAVVCRYIGAGAPAVIPVNVYLYDQGTNAWYKLNAVVNVTPTVTTASGVQATTIGTMVYFDIPAMMDKAPIASALSDGSTLGNIFVLIQPLVTGNAAVNGEYRFGVAGDMSSSP